MVDTDEASRTTSGSDFAAVKQVAARKSPAWFLVVGATSAGPYALWLANSVSFEQASLLYLMFLSIVVFLVLDHVQQ